MALGNTMTYHMVLFLNQTVATYRTTQKKADLHYLLGLFFHKQIRLDLD